MVLSDELGRKIRYVQVPLEQIRQTSQDLTLMYEWFARVGTGVDVASLHQHNPEVNWRPSKKLGHMKKTARPDNACK